MLRDRRQRPTRPFSRYMFSGRRQTVRRKADRKIHLCVDRYGHELFTALLLIILLSVLDAYFTIIHVEAGAQEVNPLMNFLISHGYMYFYAVKYILTASVVFILCIYKNVFIVRVCILSAVSLYLAVLFYHVFWIFFV